ncbi:hypothetical protein VRB49_13545 [Erwinia aphidicola]|uniref:hypothetical protein n=1 Tax=Erwinia aphidicola TaxID=68334 RepID=UPI0030CC541D
MLAQQIGEGLSEAGFEVINRVVINQVLFRASSEALTLRVREALQASGEAWFAGTFWQGKAALRVSVSSWRTEEIHLQKFIVLMARIYREILAEG